MFFVDSTRWRINVVNHKNTNLEILMNLLITLS